jgi:hypothetical protein
MHNVLISNKKPYKLKLFSPFLDDLDHMNTVVKSTTNLYTESPCYFRFWYLHFCSFADAQSESKGAKLLLQSKLA